MYTAKPLAFPNVKKFSDLFSSHRRFRNEDINRTSPGRRCGGNILTPYCAVSGARGHGSLFVEPTDVVFKFAEAEMLNLDGDHLYFRIVIRDDDTALVCIMYNKIIGDRYLALLPGSEIPAETWSDRE